MAVTQEILSNSGNLSLRQIKKLTGWDDSIVTDYVAKQEALQTIASASDENEATAQSVSDSLDTHTGNNSAHGAAGDIVGTDNYATSSIGGVVLQAVSIASASSSSATVTTASATTAGGTYDQTQVQSIVTLVNSLRAEHNAVVNDLNATITKLNAIIASMKTAKQMSN